MTQCNENSCNTGSSRGPTEENCTFAEDILCLAKTAKQELLKEKIKKGLEAKIGKKLDKVADAAVEALLTCLQQKMAAKEACEQYRENLFAAFKN